MSSYANLKLEKRGSTAIVMLSNPPAHTWTYDSLMSFQQLVSDVEADRNIYALVISGEGNKFFSAGADLNMFSDGDKARARAIARRFGEAFERLSAYHGVSIAAINGYAMGGGLECALACDLRIAESQAQMALPEATVGLLPAGGGTQKLPWVVGEGWAKLMILCGERIDAATAKAIGLVEQVVPTGGALQAALNMADQVAKQSPSSVAACKRLIQSARTSPMQLALPAEREAFVDLFDTQDQQEGVTAFLQKRKPQWRNE
jgi:enoyl-CoA hydratase/carnithine racemase